MAEHQLKSIHPEVKEAPKGDQQQVQDILDGKSPKNLIEVHIVISEDGQIGISSQNSKDKSGVSMGIVRDILQKALNRLNDDILQGCVTLQMQKLMEGNKLTRPGFRQKWFNFGK